MAIATDDNPVIMTRDQAEQLVAEHGKTFAHNTRAESFDYDKTKAKGVTVPLYFSTPGVHPYDEVTWIRRDLIQTNAITGEVIFEQRHIEFPRDWSVNAGNIVTTKYFRGAVGTKDREQSLMQVIDRVVKTYRLAGEKNGYFATSDDADNFELELTWLLLNQHFAFNSPVWFNVGTKEPQQVSACFILSVSDSMESILNWYREEGLIFKGGSGAGLNLSSIRSSKELLSSGGNSSGPVSFMRGADASAGTIKSGGATRRAAKMVILNIDHPDIEEFIDTKMREEGKIRALRDAGYEMGVNGRDIISVQYQNANNSVRVTDEFMHAVEANTSFDLKARKNGAVVETVNAADLFNKIVLAAWNSADPGIQFHDTINDWHTTPEDGPITASNPCSEYMSLDNTSCNLASLRLTKYVSKDGSFDVERFTRAVEIVITAMDISICFADFPTEQITYNTHRFRQLGIGYADLGALLMQNGLPYDSDEGRAVAACITSLMQAVAYGRSAELAGEVGTYEGYRRNEKAHLRVIDKHMKANSDIAVLGGLDAAIHNAAIKAWDRTHELGIAHGYRNAQASVLAPTGTIGFMMDCDTTGVEPGFTLVQHKNLVGGGAMTIINQGVPAALRRLGYSNETVKVITEYIVEHGNVLNAPGLHENHYEVFDCAIGKRAIAPMGHVRMMAAVQPFISGAISKTVNMPEAATMAEVREVYYEGWRCGIKALAIYRDNCKVGQPLSDAKAKTDKIAAVSNKDPVRIKMPRKRPSQTVSFEVAGAEGYLIAGSYPNGGLGEVFLKLGKQGSTLAGVMDAFSIAVSIALQYGVPLEAFVSKFVNMRFDPAGMTNDEDIRIAQSMMDYIFRRLAIDYLSYEKRAELAIFTSEERNNQVEVSYEKPDKTAFGLTKNDLSAPRDHKQRPSVIDPNSQSYSLQGADAPLCGKCGTKMRTAGACFVCEGCGETSGCS
jgi:ribonucleoside-diphosphate reductase alpha chain